MLFEQYHLLLKQVLLLRELAIDPIGLFTGKVLNRVSQSALDVAELRANLFDSAIIVRRQICQDRTSSIYNSIDQVGLRANPLQDSGADCAACDMPVHDRIQILRFADLLTRSACVTLTIGSARPQREVVTWTVEEPFERITKGLAGCRMALAPAPTFLPIRQHFCAFKKFVIDNAEGFDAMCVVRQVLADLPRIIGFALPYGLENAVAPIAGVALILKESFNGMPRPT